MSQIKNRNLRIVNLDKNTTLATQAALANNLFKRLIGLLGRRSLFKDEAIILKPCNSLHTFFMRFAIDVVFVDKENRVVKAIENLKPFRLTPIYFQAGLAIELPAGILAATQTKAGDLLAIIE